MCAGNWRGRFWKCGGFVFEVGIVENWARGPSMLIKGGEACALWR